MRESSEIGGHHQEAADRKAGRYLFERFYFAEPKSINPLLQAKKDANVRLSSESAPRISRRTLLLRLVLQRDADSPQGQRCNFSRVIVISQQFADGCRGRRNVCARLIMFVRERQAWE